MRVIRPLLDHRGFSLLFIVLLFTAAGLLAFAGISMGLKFSNTGKNVTTRQRMKVIQDAARSYYRAHQTLPTANDSSAPVSADAFNLQAKYKQDSWGQKFFCRWDAHPAPYMLNRTNINGLTVDGSTAAGVIISNGPNQILDTGVSTAIINQAGDDIVLGINLHAEAMEIAQSNMEVIRHKLWAYAVAHPEAPSPPASFWSYFGLPDSYQYDPWGNRYIVSSSGIRTSDGNIFLPLLTKPGPDGVTPLPPAIAGGNFEALLPDNKVDLGGWGAFSGNLFGDAGLSLAGDSLEFDGSDDYVSGGNDSGYTIYQGSWGAWIYFSSLNDTMVLGKENSYWLEAGADGAIIAGIKVNDSSYSASTGAGFAQNDSWYHVIATYDQTTLNLYVNGEIKASTNTPPNGRLDSSPNAFILGTNTLKTSWFNGRIDNLVIFDIALTPCQITDLYLITLGLPADAVAIWHFDEVAGQVVNDSSCNNRDGWLGVSDTNDSRDPLRVSGKSGNALAFDGNDDVANVGIMPALTNFTLTCWLFHNDSDATYDRITSLSNDSFDIATDTNDSLWIKLGWAGSGWVKTNDSLILNGWTHRAFVYNGAQFSIYANDSSVPVSVYSTVVSGTLPSLNWYFGNSDNDSTAANIKLDEVFLYDRALTPAQIQKISGN